MAKRKKRVIDLVEEKRIVKIVSSLPKNTSQIKKLKTKSKKSNYCPKCKDSLIAECTYIPLPKNKFAVVKGNHCRSCNTLYVDNNNDIIQLIIGNNLANGYTYNGYDLPSFNSEGKTNNSNPAKSKKQKIESPTSKKSDRILQYNKAFDDAAPYDIKIKVLFEKGNIIDEFLILFDKDEIDDEDNHILHYTDFSARELLTAAYVDGRHKVGFLNEGKFRVLECKIRNQRYEDFCRPSKIIIRNDGGVNVRGRFEGIVDLLVYTEKYDVYQILKASYNKSNGLYYVDFELFLYFVENYGNPLGVNHFQIHKDYNYSHSRMDFSDWNEESIYHECGYVVGKTNGLPHRNRIHILTYIIDLKISSKEETLSYLKRCMQIYDARNFEYAYADCAQDYEVIKRYMPNPDRFDIVK